MAKRCVFTPEVNQYVIDNIDKVLYKDMVNDIKEKFGLIYTPRQLSGRANNMGLKQFKPKQYDRNFFDIINSTEKAYWLGFIYADGWLTQTPVNAELGIELAEKDRHHLARFCEALGASTHSIKSLEGKETVIKATGQIVQPHPSAVLRLYSKDLVNGLIKNKITLRKTYSDISPDFIYGEELNLAMIRGYFDGDGGIDKNGHVKFTAYRIEFLEKLQKYLSDTYNIEGRVFKETRSDGKTHIHRFTIHDTSVKNLLNLLYQDLSYTYLDRKYRLYNDLHKAI